MFFGPGSGGQLLAIQRRPQQSQPRISVKFGKSLATVIPYLQKRMRRGYAQDYQQPVSQDPVADEYGEDQQTVLLQDVYAVVEPWPSPSLDDDLIDSAEIQRYVRSGCPPQTQGAFMRAGCKIRSIRLVVGPPSQHWDRKSPIRAAGHRSATGWKWSTHASSLNSREKASIHPI